MKRTINTSPPLTLLSSLALAPAGCSAAFADNSACSFGNSPEGITFDSSGDLWAEILACARRAITLAAAALFLSAAIGSAASAQVRTSGNNYWLATPNCSNVSNLKVSLYVTRDMVAEWTGANGTTGTGFGIQLNANPFPGQASPNGQPYTWLQYIMMIHNVGGQPQAQAMVEYWYAQTTQQYATYPTIDPLPSYTIEAGSILSIQLTTDGQGYVTGIEFSVTDNTGYTYPPLQMQPVFIGETTPLLVRFQSFQVDVVGPWDYQDSTFSSGQGYITYTASDGPLGTGTCPVGLEPGEMSNAFYGPMGPSMGSSLVQPLSSPNSGALTSSMDTAGNKLQVYHLAQNPQTQNVDINQFALSGTWVDTDVSTLPTSVTGNPIPPAVIGSPLLTYENTIYQAPETFYLVANNQGIMQIEQLWGENSNPNNLSGSAQAPTPASSLAGFIDPIVGTDNVFYQGTDQHIHLLSWSPGQPWAEDTRIASANAPVAAFASQLSGHMTAQSEELFYVGSNQHVYELWRWSKNYDGWHLTDVTIANGTKTLAAVGTTLAGFWDSAAGTDVVFYMGVDQHARELLFAGSIWSGIDVTGTSHAPALAVGSAITAHFNTSAGSEEVFVVNQDQTLEEMWSWPSQTPTWNAQDTFSGNAASAQLVNLGSPLTTDMDSVSMLTDEVYYVGTDGNVHEVWSSSNSGGWRPGAP
jgi:hypothetical protein